MKIAVLPTNVGSPSAVAAQIGRSSIQGRGLTVAVPTADTKQLRVRRGIVRVPVRASRSEGTGAEAANRTQLQVDP